MLGLTAHNKSRKPMKSSHHASDETPSSAEEAFAQYIRRRESGASETFQQYCEKHARFAAELNELHRDWLRISGILDRWGGENAVLERLTDQVGAEHLSRVQLDREPDDAESDVRGLFTQLRLHRSSSPRYRIKGEVGRGGMGVVLRVWDSELRRNLAMKMILGSSDRERRDPLAAERDSVVRFLEEAQVTAQLDHPGIVPVHELGLDNQGRVYFTMRLVRGRSLAEVFELVNNEREGWTRLRAIGLILRACEAVAYAHDKGVIHRDLKPANIMVGKFGEVYVMDWGLARVLDQEDLKDIRIRDSHSTDEEASRTGSKLGPMLATMDGHVIGTPAYMSPEQARGDVRAMGTHSDVYAIGAILYHLLSGEPPYANEGVSSPHTMLKRIAEGPPRPLELHASDRPAELVAICTRAMAPVEHQRYPTVAELADDLNSYLEGRVVRAYETGAFAELRKWVRRNRALTTAASLAVLAVLIGSLGISRVQAAGQREQLLLTDAFLLPYFITEAEALWPAHPPLIPGMQSWLEQVGTLLEKEDVHRERLERFQGADSSVNSGYARQEQLVQGLEALRAEGGLVEQMEARLQFASTIEERSRTGSNAQKSWDAAIAAIADRDVCPRYEGLSIRPQLGLLPIGQNPHTGLWEFAHLQTGEVPQLDDDGLVITNEEMGLVFVLLPGGTFQMGSQTDAGSVHFDPMADGDEGPRHPVTLSPFFMSKYEMTQGQWMRFTGENPSYYHERRYQAAWNKDDTPYSSLHPVEQVSWNDCQRVLESLGMLLPSEAQWEYAARGGTTTPWWTGDHPESLIGAVNLADARTKSIMPHVECEVWDDGYHVHAPVGSLRSNDFGLYDMSGNVWEWCRDRFEADYYSRSPEMDPVNRAGDESSYVIRGGCCTDPAYLLRVTYRNNNAAGAQDHVLGVRPVLPLSR